MAASMTDTREEYLRKIRAVVIEWGRASNCKIGCVMVFVDLKTMDGTHTVSNLSGDLTKALLEVAASEGFDDEAEQAFKTN